MLSNINDVHNIRQAVHLAHLDSIDEVTVAVTDLVALERYMKELEQKIHGMEIKLVATNIKLSNVISESLTMKCATRLDTFV